MIKGRAKPKRKGDFFTGSIRRKGKFKLVSVGDLQKVITGATTQARFGLGQTIKIRRVGGGSIRGLGTPKGFARVRGRFGIFRETPKARIDTGSEIRLLAQARRKARKKTKTKTKSKRRKKK